MDWFTIENSYFWIGISNTFKSYTIRFKMPLASKLTEFRIHRQTINLVGEETEDEKKILKEKARKERVKQHLLHIKKEEIKWFNKEREQSHERAKKDAVARAQQQLGCSVGSES